MPLHDWTRSAGWEGVHHLWISELLFWLKPRLPEPFRAYIGSTPALELAAIEEKPDVAVRRWQPDPGAAPALAGQPDFEGPAILELDPQTAIHVKARGQLVAAIELVSPRNKDRHDSRANYLARYRNYLIDGVNLLLVDVHRRPVGFSFAEVLEASIRLERPPLPPPLVAAYRVGEPVPKGGRLVAVWRRPLIVGEPIPAMPLPLTVHQEILVDLEATYRRAAEGAYLD